MAQFDCVYDYLRQNYADRCYSKEEDSVTYMANLFVS